MTFVVSPIAERLLCEMRSYLAIAYELERAGDLEYAAAAGLVAANVLHRAIRVQKAERVKARKRRFATPVVA